MSTKPPPRRGRPRGPGLRKRRAAAACAPVLLAALLGASCTREPARLPDVILVSLDTVRADHLSLYGYPRATSPNLDALGERSLVFERAYTAAAHTLPAHASLLTGTEPDRHGAVGKERGMAEGLPHLSSLLREQGYRTAAFTNANFVAPEYGFDTGFDHFDYDDRTREARGGEATNEAIEAWLDETEDARPLFLFAHFYDAHSDWARLPYEAPEPYRSRFVLPEPEDFRPPDDTQSGSLYLARFNRDQEAIPPDHRQYIVSLYDAGVAHTDGILGTFLEILRARGLLDHAIVIVTSDHGEEFQEHGYTLHAQVYEELVRVPLLVSFPEMRGGQRAGCRDGGGRIEAGRVSWIVQHVDLLPTLARCLGLEVPDGVQGISWLAAARGTTPPRDAARFRTLSGRQQGLRQGRWKLVWWRKDERHALYDLERDAGETRDRSQEHPEVAEALLRRLQAERAAGAGGATVELSPEQEEALQALGYVEESEGPAPP